MEFEQKFEAKSDAKPDAKPMMAYDADCAFCLRWVKRWRRIIGDRVYLAPYQQIASSFPSISGSEFEESIHLITPDGQVFKGAEAVFRGLAYNPSWRWVAWAYDHIPGVKWITELLYRWVASHRKMLSRWTP